MKKNMLKHAILGVGICLFNFQSFGQATQSTTTPSKEAEADSTFTSFQLFTDEYAKIMETGAQKRKSAS